MKRILLFVPVTIFAALAAYMFFGLTRIDTQVIPTVMLDRPMPEFDLPAVSDEIPPFSTEDLKGQVSLVNVFGSWCVACLQEHWFLMDLQRAGIIPIYGIDWVREGAEPTTQWLERLGNPFDRIGVDAEARTIIDLGVTGAPETFIVDAEGRIRAKHVGPLHPELWDKELWPLILQLREEAASAGITGDVNAEL